MEYFDACKLEPDLLRAKFKTASKKEMRSLAKAFAPVAKAIAEKGSIEKKARIGFISEEQKAGKSTFANKIKKYAGLKKTLLKWMIRCQSSVVLYHYDCRNIAQYKYRIDEFGGLDTEEERAVYATHQCYAKNATAHFIEWPERDDDNSLLNAAWEVIRRDEKSNEREFAFYAPKEIEDMPEYRTFIEKADKAGLLIEEISP